MSERPAIPMLDQLPLEKVAAWDQDAISRLAERFVEVSVDNERSGTTPVTGGRKVV